MAATRRIFVGDVQGCAEELEELLRRARGEFGRDFELWVVGDLVNRGPGSLRALERVRELVDAGRGHLVLGNHELLLLRTAVGLRALAPHDSFGDVLASPASDDWVEWLRRRPLAVTGRLGVQPFALVHAAVHPAWSLPELESRARRAGARLAAADRAVAEALLAAPAEADEDADTLARLTACRSVDGEGNWSSQIPERGSRWEAWHRPWAARGHGYGVVYGHWALQGLHVAPWLRGLDTGCVHHGRGRDGALTAWLPDPEAETPFSIPDDRFWQVPARRAYYREAELAVSRARTDSR